MKPANSNPPARPVPARQRGVVLIAALAVLLMLTLLSIGMFRGLGLEERITGNSREKQHAFYAAQSALQYAEQQLLSPSLGAPIDCLPGIILAPGTITVCDAATAPSLQSLASSSSIGSSWSTINGATPYAFPSSTSFTSSTSAAGTSTYLYATPQYQVSWLGPDPTTAGGYLYAVTALGYGANANSTSVVQSVYSVVPAVTVNTNGNSY
jgi:type IV pilus assembly protein PilX